MPFKINFLVDCLTKSYVNPCFDEEMITESSFCKDFCLGVNIYKLLDSLSEKVVWKINLESIHNAQYMVSPRSTMEEIENAWNEGMLGKKTLEMWLAYYLSEELGRIARERIYK